MEAAAKAGRQVLLIDENPVAAALAGTDVPLWFGGRATAALQAPERLIETLVENEPLIAGLFRSRALMSGWARPHGACGAIARHAGAMPRAMLGICPMGRKRATTLAFEVLDAGDWRARLCAGVCRVGSAWRDGRARL